MVSINLFGTSSSWGTASIGVKALASPGAIEGSGEVAATASGGTSAISNLARQLSEAAGRAAVRDASMSRAQLAATAKALQQELVEYKWSGRSSLDVPQTDDPELVARAKQATAFVNGRGANPFAGLSREQLCLIMYDKGDAFTIDERYAALDESSRQRCLWSQRVVEQGWNEMQATGTFTNFFKACIAEYQTAPLIEQATYPKNYAALTQRWIDFWESGRGTGDMMKDLLAVLQMPLTTPRKYDESLSWGMSSKLSSTGLGKSYSA